MEPKEQEAFLNYLKEKGFKKTPQRQAILEGFLGLKGHVATDELYRSVIKKHPNIGYSTVFRSLKLLKEAKIASEVNFTGKRKRFEKGFARGHHDHLICLNCGKTIEVFDPKIEKLQDVLAKHHNFKPARHRLEIFGLCKNCG